MSEEFEDPCPICLVNIDDVINFFAHDPGMCFACGQLYCGACNNPSTWAKSPNCPTCRAPFVVSDEDSFKRCWKLVHDRSPGRHTPRAQNNLGHKYDNGVGVKQDYTEAVQWYRRAADQGFADAQFNLALMYDNGDGVQQNYTEAIKWYQCAAEKGHAGAQGNLGGMCYHGYGVSQDFAEALKWFQLSAEQGDECALGNLKALQQQNVDFPTPPPGTTITTVLLTSAAASKYNKRIGKVVVPAKGVVVNPGRVAVLLEGNTNPLSFKLMNLKR